VGRGGGRWVGIGSLRGRVKKKRNSPFYFVVEFPGCRNSTHKPLSPKKNPYSGEFLKSKLLYSSFSLTQWSTSIFSNKIWGKNQCWPGIYVLAWRQLGHAPGYGVHWLTGTG
jgi:hypothetical protein